MKITSSPHAKLHTGSKIDTGEKACFVRGYHVYQDVWDASVSEDLTCQRELSNLLVWWRHLLVRWSNGYKGNFFWQGSMWIWKAVSLQNRLKVVYKRHWEDSDSYTIQSCARVPKICVHRNIRGQKFRSPVLTTKIKIARKFQALRYVNLYLLHVACSLEHTFIKCHIVMQPWYNVHFHVATLVHVHW